MARVKGPFVIEGTIDGINFYVDEGKNLARKAGGGFNGDAIKTKPNMVRVRENGSEFGHCASVKRVFRRALSPYLFKIKGRKLHSDMTSMFVQIKIRDAVSERGKRTVAAGLNSAEGMRLLETYAYPKDYSLYSVLGNRFSMDWGTQQCACADFTSDSIFFPEEATHVGLLFGLVVMDFEVPESDIFLAEEFMVSRTTGHQPVVLTPLTEPAGNGKRIAVMGVRFYQEVNGMFHRLEVMRGVVVLEVV